MRLENGVVSFLSRAFQIKRFGYVQFELAIQLFEVRLMWALFLQRGLKWFAASVTVMVVFSRFLRADKGDSHGIAEYRLP